MAKVPEKTVLFRDLGHIPYREAWDLQQRLLDEKVAEKTAMRRGELQQTEAQLPDHLLFCEHPHVLTLGKSGKLEHLLVSESELQRRAVEFYKINRGGDITYHGPGQLTGYPILDLDRYYTDIVRYLRELEEVFIRVLALYGLKGERSAGETGVWLDVEKGQPRKIVALGVRCSRWVTMHGFGFNINTDLSYFEQIIPCGISGKSVTSLQAELGHRLDMKLVKAQVLQSFEEVFGVRALAKVEN